MSVGNEFMQVNAIAKACLVEVGPEKRHDVLEQATFELQIFGFTNNFYDSRREVVEALFDACCSPGEFLRKLFVTWII